MKNFLLTISLFFLVATTYAQNYSFMQLIEMTNDSKLFEINMIKGLNQMHKKKKTITYSYHLSDGTIGASPKLPTNDSKYEPKYRFDNGVIYTQSEIEDQELDESYEIRNRLRKNGNQLNKAVADSFYFHKEKITSLIKSETTEIGFGENYNAEEKTASKWYTWESDQLEPLLIGSKLFSPNYKKLTVQYVSNEEFNTMLKQITTVTKYIETKEDFGSFVSYYRYNTYLITTERSENNYGGLVTIRIEK
jgi:hypothetical protein